MISLPELKKLHEKGLALIYLRPKSKRPFETAWTTQSKKSWEELENSFEASYNVGVRLGEPSKLLTGRFLGAIDCDVKSGSRKAITEMNEALRALGLDLGSCPIVMSGRGNGSKHIYVQTLKPMRAMKYAQSSQFVKVLMPGEGSKPHSKKEMKELTEEERASGYRIRASWEISFMGAGQQVVLPPSIHPDTGMKYAWASPLTVKHVPIFHPEKFVKEVTGKRMASHEQETIRFQATEVDLYTSRLSYPMIKMIETGEGCEDRSASLLSIAMAMCRAQFTDNEILSVLSDPSHWVAQAAYEHTQSQDRARAVNWLRRYTLEKARYQTDIMRRFDNKPVLKKLTTDQVRDVKEKAEDDAHSILPNLDGKGKPQPTLRNMVQILEHFMEGGVVGFNEFSARPYFLKNTAYGGIKGQEISDHHDLALKHYIACHYRFEPSKELCFEAHSFIAKKYAYHPVKEYLENLTWDSVPRLDTWLESAFKAEGPEDYLKAVSRKVLTAAVARVFEPGCKFDYVLVLEGNQGEGKSMTLGLLAGQPWFTDGLGDIHNKDVVDQMTGKWIIELSELASIRGRENEAVKSFLSRQVDRVRMSYGRRSEDYPRQSIFIGSTNSSEYFTDETGNRRYWPVKVKEANRKWLTNNRDQLWAEARVRYELGENLYLTKKIEKVAREEQENRFEIDEWESEIQTIISKTKEPYVSTELWRAIHKNDGNGHPSDYECKRLAKIMKRLGFEKSNRRLDGIQSKCWMKK